MYPGGPFFFIFLLPILALTLFSLSSLVRLYVHYFKAHARIYIQYAQFTLQKRQTLIEKRHKRQRAREREREREIDKERWRLFFQRIIFSFILSSSLDFL
jgi:hypothetical protein